jgi:hypothetical protein
MINGGTTTAIHVRDGWKELKLKYLQKESAIKNFLIMQPLRRAYRKLFTLSGNYQDTLRIFQYLVTYNRVISLFKKILCILEREFALVFLERNHCFDNRVAQDYRKCIFLFSEVGE